MDRLTLFAQHGNDSVTPDVAYGVAMVVLILALGARCFQSLKRGSIAFALAGGKGASEPRDRFDPLVMWLSYLIVATSLSHGLTSAVFRRTHEGLSAVRPIDALAFFALAAGFGGCVALQVSLRRRGGCWPQDTRTRLLLTLPMLLAGACAIVWVVAS